MTHRINTAGTAAVATGTHWLHIDANTPQGVKLQLINRQSGIAPDDVHGIKLVISTDLLRRTIDLLKSLRGDSDMAQFECWDMINLIDELEALPTACVDFEYLQK